MSQKWVVAVLAAVLACSWAAPQLPGYQPVPWVYPKPTSEPSVPAAVTVTRPPEVSNFTPQKNEAYKPVVALASSSAVNHAERQPVSVDTQEGTTLAQVIEKEQQENVGGDPQDVRTTTISPAENKEINSQRYDILGVAIAPAVIDRKKFKPIKDTLYW